MKKESYRTHVKHFLGWLGSKELRKFIVFEYRECLLRDDRVRTKKQKWYAFKDYFRNMGPIGRIDTELAFKKAEMEIPYPVEIHKETYRLLPAEREKLLAGALERQPARFQALMYCWDRNRYLRLNEILNYRWGDPEISDMPSPLIIALKAINPNSSYVFASENHDDRPCHRCLITATVKRAGRRILKKVISAESLRLPAG